MRTYSNPIIQEAMNGIHDNIQQAQAIIERMEKSKQMMGRREFDKSRPIELTQSQRDTIAKNKGVHIYGKSHPLYKGE